MANLDDGATEAFPCAFSDELHFSHRLGEPILIANTAPAMEHGYVAIGRLKRFETDVDGGTRVQIEKIRSLIKVVPLSDMQDMQQRISEIPDIRFGEILAAALGEGYNEDQTAAGAIPVDAFAQQLRQAQNDHCGFSDVATEEGTAFMIRPPEHGGRWHTDNFLFLDPEPGKLFANFAWTVGPQLEIIVDAYAVGPNVSDTVNRTGMLALKETLLSWPDRDALAWHRDRFFDRLRG